MSPPSAGTFTPLPAPGAPAAHEDTAKPPGGGKLRVVFSTLGIAFLALAQGIALEATWGNIDEKYPSMDDAWRNVTMSFVAGGVVLFLMMGLRLWKAGFLGPGVGAILGLLTGAGMASSLKSYPAASEQANAPYFLFSAALYFLLIIPIGIVIGLKERRLARPTRASSIVAGLTSLVVTAFFTAGLYLLFNFDRLEAEAIEAHKNDAPALGAIAALIALTATAWMWRRPNEGR